nr:retrotransposon protein, putative, Ty1-copia subclass [Tanacetum cinerariifolium]
MFEKPQAVEIYDLVDALHSCKQALGKSLDTGRGTALFTSKSYEKNKDKAEHGAEALEERKLSYDEQYLQVGNGAQAVGEAIGELAHIGKTRMQKLRREGLLESINDESFDKYESCISGKMIKKPFNNNIERATDLLGLIHTDVCGPIRHVSRKEVELQLGKKIKALCSDRGGEYLSQEFKDYLKVEDDEVGDLREPANYKAAMLDPDKVIWQGAMDEEMNSMKVMKVWIVVDLPPNAKVVRSKWLYKKKTDMDGNVHIYKARLVAKGCTQTYGIDYEETFSPVADIRAIRILKAITAYYDYEIWKMYVKTAFLNGRLDEDIYMKQPKGIKDVKDYLGKCFSMKDLGEAAYILRIKIYRDRSRWLIGLSQSAYIDKILKKYNTHNSKKGYLPMEVKHDLSNKLCASTPKEVAYMKKVPYALAVGSIMYDVRCTRTDVAFAQNLVSRYQQNPGKLHWVTVKHILKYLMNTRDMFLVYGGKPDTKLDVTSFCDASWQCDKDDTKSQTAQAEYVAASEAAMEAVWIRKFVGDLGVMPLINKPINMYYENSAAIIFANEPGIMKSARHFLWRYHYVREQVETGEIKLIKVHTDDNLADPFTKALLRGMVIDHANGVGLQLATSFMYTCD